MVTAQDKKEIDINGYVTYYDVPMTKIGVFPYLGRQISPELEPDKIYHVLRPEEELTSPETLKSLEKIPFINDHTMLGKEFTLPEDVGIEGTTLTNVKVKKPLITNDLTAYTERVKDLIEKRDKRDLSMGYRCRYELKEGEYEGQHYDAIQRDIRFNHIALVDEGRMGSECRVMDSSITFDSITELLQQKEKNEMSEFKEELKEEIKDELLNGEEEIETKREEVLDEEPENKPLEAGIVEGDEDVAKDGDEDKRKLIDEIGGILNGKVDEEILRTILKKAEELAYNPSETGANDACGKDEEVIEEKEEEKKEGLSMDEAIKYIAKRDSLVASIRPVIGDNAKYSSMTIKEVVKYACDKLDIKPSLDSLEGYIKAASKQKQYRGTIATDSAVIGKSPVMKKYDEINK